MGEEKLVEDYSRMVYSIISKFYPYCDREDLYQVGMMGLTEAFKHYDQSYQSSFSTYAYKYIMGEVLKYVREDRSIKVSKDVLKLSKSILKAKEVLAQKFMRNPTDSELSLFLEIPLEEIQACHQACAYVLSLDASLNEDDDGKDLSLGDTISFEEKKYDARIQDLYRELANLPEDERKLIEYRYFEDKTQSETSEDLGMSQVQVSRSESKILTKLQRRLVA